MKIPSIITNSTLFKHLLNKTVEHYYPKDQKNINIDLTCKQKRILISYMPIGSIDLLNVNHAMYMHINQIIKYFINKNFCIDICACNDTKAYERLRHNKYDILFGFGEVFSLFANKCQIETKILFVTENYPITVERLYNERVNYFNQRHPNINYKKAIVRKGFFTEQMFKTADYIIAMTSAHNIKNMKKNGNIFSINANAIKNHLFDFNKHIVENNQISKAKYNFIWFGSDGFIHKGLDILLDAFRELPDYKLNIYGLSPNEKYLFKKLKSTNTINKGRINVQTNDFIEAMSENTFVILPSCSEGMNTGVVTCMLHGMIPIITRESGLNNYANIITLENYNVQTIIDTIKNVSNLPDKTILNIRKEIYEYAQKEFSLTKFTESFEEIMNNILSKK